MPSKVELHINDKSVLGSSASDFESAFPNESNAAPRLFPDPPLLPTNTTGEYTGSFSNDDICTGPSSSPTVKQNIFVKTLDVVNNSGTFPTDTSAPGVNPGSFGAGSGTSSSLGRDSDITEALSLPNDNSADMNNVNSHVLLSNQESFGQNTNLELGLTAADIGLELTPEQQLVAQRQHCQEGRGLSFFGITGLGKQVALKGTRSSVGTFSSFESDDSFESDEFDSTSQSHNTHALKRMGAACVADVGRNQLSGPNLPKTRKFGKGR